MAPVVIMEGPLRRQIQVAMKFPPSDHPGEARRSANPKGRPVTTSRRQIERVAFRLFAQHGLPLPSRFVEADDESVIRNLVASGVGASLLREEAAVELERAGTVKIWGETRVSSTLWFVALAGRRDDPLIQATFELVRESWQAEASRERGAVATI